MPQPWLGRLERRAYIPSLACRIAMIADGSLDATFVKANAHDWDLAAADLILREAGGKLLNSSGECPAYAGATVAHGALVAGSGELLYIMADVIARHARSASGP
jgi:myo-inositol-1(or 4)-monophosphatase